jgi:hypothetical protein
MFVYTLIILLIVILLSAITIYVVHKMPRLKIIFQIFYGLILIFLGIYLVSRIMKPINFKAERIRRENTAIERLKDIRKSQEAYKSKYGKYTASFDTLIHYIKTDSFEIPKLELSGKGVWDQDEMTQEQAIKKGILRKTIIKKSVRDSLFSPDYNIDDLRYIPYTGNKKEFVMKAGEVETGSQLKVKVFEAYALYDILFNGMDRQEVINYKDQRYKITEFNGVKVGSITEANNNAGNWEK